MINKTEVFASGSEHIDVSSAGYTEGMIPQTVARAEQVNKYMQIGDKDLYVVCQELKNLMAKYGIVPNESYNTSDMVQIRNMFDSVVQNAFVLTGITSSSYTGSAPTQTGNSIAFPEMKILFNTDVYYGRTDATHKECTLSAATLAATNAWTNGVWYIYAKKTSDTVCVLDKQADPVSPEDAATKCLLGSVYVINGAFQDYSWKFQPWLQITSPERRESPTAMSKGGEIRPDTTTTLKIGVLEVLDEGIGFDASPYTPSIAKLVDTQKTFTYKFIYPGYNSSQTDVSTLDTTHAFNMGTNTFDDISSMSTETDPKFVIMVPCITPAGQTLLVPPMYGELDGVTYNQIYSSMDDAISAVWNQMYKLVGANGQSVASRCIFLNQAFVVRVGATDLTDARQFVVVGEIPHALGSFTSAVGQTGGSIADYRPMPSITWSGTGAVTCKNNAVNVIPNTGTTNRSITMPTPQSGIANQLEIHFTKTNTGVITFTNTIKWWLGVAPAFNVNQAYNIILEYIDGNWYGGYLSVTA